MERETHRIKKRNNKERAYHTHKTKETEKQRETEAAEQQRMGILFLDGAMNE